MSRTARRVSLCYVGPGYDLIVRDVPIRAAFGEWLYENLMTALGSPCCVVRHGTTKRSWAGWLLDHAPGDLEREGSLVGRLQVAQYMLLNNRIERWLTRGAYDTDVLRVRITRTEAHKLHPDFVATCDKLHDAEPHTYASAPTCTYTTPSNITVTYSNASTITPR